MSHRKIMCALVCIAHNYIRGNNKILCINKIMAIRNNET